MPDSTLADVFLRNVTGPLQNKVVLYSKAVATQPFQGITFGEFGQRVGKVAAALRNSGIKNGDRIAILSESRPEWLISDFAAMLVGAITVPMFPTLTAAQVEHILVDSGARIAIVSNELQLGKVAKSKANARALERVFFCNPTPPTIPQAIAEQFSLFSELEASAIGLSLEDALAAVKPEDVVTFIYTSGTTGTPKGVMLTHGNLLSNVEGARAAIPAIDESDLFLSFLPLSHSFERIASYLAFSSGAAIAYAPSIDSVAENLLEIRPTIMTGVPRFYERIHLRIVKMREKMPKRNAIIFDWAIRVGGEVGKGMEGLPVSVLARLQYPIADRLVLRKIRERTGGRIRFFVSGAAALSLDVGRAFAAFGLPILEGYGMTECSPVISVNPATKIKWGKVGPALRNIEVRIAVDGEILTRGPHVMRGYYNLPQDTLEAIDSDGWLHTGDIGTLDTDGYIQITDRKKHLFVSSGGKNIAPAPIESLLLESELIDQIMLVGDKRQFLTALIVPDYDALKVRLAEMGTPTNLSHSELVQSEQVRKLFEAVIERQLRTVASYERVRRFSLLAEPFTIENAMLTPTLKVKRKEVETRYKDLIDSLYFDARRENR